MCHGEPPPPGKAMVIVAADAESEVIESASWSDLRMRYQAA